MESRKYSLKIDHLPPEKLKFRLQPSKFATLPSIVDLRSKMPPVYEQGKIGSCTAQAICAAFQYLIPAFMGSRLFLYYNERKLDGTIPDDAGASLSDGITCMQRYGLCAETMWPYIESKFSVPPPEQCYTAARKFQADEVLNIRQDLNSMRTSLANGYPFVIGFMVYSSFESRAVTRTGVVPMPTFRDRPLGGHAVLVCGYNDARQHWICRNSWGASWGDKGYFYMPYNYLTNQRLASDIWNITSSNTRFERTIVSMKRKRVFNRIFHRG